MPCLAHKEQNQESDLQAQVVSCGIGDPSSSFDRSPYVPKFEARRIS